MKRAIHAVFIASVLLNVYLIGSRRSSPTSEPIKPSGRFVQVDTQQPKTPAPAGLDANPAAINPHRQFNWRQVESPDYKTYIDNLRTAGCPLETIRDIVSADLRKSFRSKEWQLLRHATSTQYWADSFQIGTFLHAEDLSALRSIADQFNSAHKELLNSEPEEPFNSSQGRVEMEILAKYGNLDWETIQKIAPIQTHLYAELRQQIGNDSREEDLIQKAQDEIATFLTPEQQDTFELRSSPLAQRLRTADLNFNSAEQFRGVFFPARNALGNSRNIGSLSDEGFAAQIAR